MGQLLSQLGAASAWSSTDAVGDSSSSWSPLAINVWLAMAGLVVLLCHLGDIALMLRFIWICSIAPTLGLAPNRPNRTAFIREHVHHAKVTTRDLDLMFHMNNARYLREADFARHKLLVECGLFQAAWKRKTPFVTASQTIRYRKELKFGAKYRILSSIVGWDEKCVIIQQVFVTSGRSHNHHHHHGTSKSPASREPAGGKSESGDVVHAVLIVREGMAGAGRAHHHHQHHKHHSAQREGGQGDPRVNPLQGGPQSAEQQQQTPHAVGGPFQTLLESLGWDKDSADGKQKALPLSRNPPTDIMEWLHSTLETSARVVDGGK